MAWPESEQYIPLKLAYYQKKHKLESFHGHKIYLILLYICVLIVTFTFPCRQNQFAQMLYLYRPYVWTEGQINADSIQPFINSITFIKAKEGFKGNVICKSVKIMQCFWCRTKATTTCETFQQLLLVYFIIFSLHSFLYVPSEFYLDDVKIACLSF